MIRAYLLSSYTVIFLCILFFGDDVDDGVCVLCMLMCEDTCAYFYVQVEVTSQHWGYFSISLQLFKILHLYSFVCLCVCVWMCACYSTHVEIRDHFQFFLSMVQVMGIKLRSSGRWLYLLSHVAGPPDYFFRQLLNLEHCNWATLVVQKAPRILHVCLPVLRYSQTPQAPSCMWVLGIKMRFPFSCSKHFINWAVSPALLSRKC